MRGGNEGRGEESQRREEKDGNIKGKDGHRKIEIALKGSQCQPTSPVQYLEITCK